MNAWVLGMPSEESQIPVRSAVSVRFVTDNNEEDSIMDFLKVLAPNIHWALRLSLAATFVYHGVGKFPIEGPMAGLPIPVVWAVALAEVAAGLMLIAGAFGKETLTRLAGLIVVVIMIGALAIVHIKHGFGDSEFQLLMLAVGLYFAAKGNDA
jgi:putative oxidoreductase